LSWLPPGALHTVSMGVSMKLQLAPRRVAVILLCGVALLTVGQLLTVSAGYPGGYQHTSELLRVASFRGDNNLATWYSSMLLSGCALLLGVIATAVRRQAAGGWLPWAGLALTFVGLSIDDLCRFHEMMSDPMDQLFEYPGPLHYSWVIPGAVFVLMFVGAFARFLIRLPRRSRWSFVGAGALFIGGALGMEMVLGIQTKSHGSNNLTFDILLSTKKLMQLLGSTVFLCALLAHVRDHLPGLSIRPGGDRTESP
jgi:hypothetical protein